MPPVPQRCSTCSINPLSWACTLPACSIFPPARSPRGIAAAAYATNMPPACLLNAAGRQPKWDTRRTDYEEAGGPAEIQWLFGLKSDSDRLDKSGGPARRGLALFPPTFGRTARRPLSTPPPAGHSNERKWARRRQASAEGRCRPSQRHRPRGCLTPVLPQTAPKCCCR